MRKKIMTAMLAAVLACSICACGGSGVANADKKAETKQEESKKDKKTETEYVVTKQETTYEGKGVEAAKLVYEFSYDEDAVQIGMKETGYDEDGKELKEKYGQNNYHLEKDGKVYKRFVGEAKEADAEYTFTKEGHRKTTRDYATGKVTTYKYQENGRLDKVVTKDKDGNKTRVITYGNTDEYETNFMIKTEYEGKVEREYKAKYDTDKETVTFILIKGAAEYYPYQVVFKLHGDKGVDSLEQYDKDGNILSRVTSEWDDKIGHVVKSVTESNQTRSTTVNTWEKLK